MNTFRDRAHKLSKNMFSERLLQRTVTFYLNKAGLKNFTAVAGLLIRKIHLF